MTTRESGDPQPIQPIFGEWFTGVYASDDNPQKHGRYVRTIRRRGRMNPGAFYELTDGHGVFWQYPIDSVVRRDEMVPEHDEDAWRDYDHGFRDGYQAALRERGGGDDLLAAARWVVENWDREATQHGSMAALRQAVQRRDENATKP